MGIVNGYCTLAELKARLNLVDADDDVMLESVVNGVSRWIEDWCSRRFWLTPSSAEETRYYTALWPDLLYVDDLYSVTTLATDGDGDGDYEVEWAASDYHLEPRNALSDGKPYTYIRVKPRGQHVFPSVVWGVKITGRWGWPAVPPQVKEACLLQSERLFKRKDTPFGIEGTAELGTVSVIPRLDPDVQMLLSPLRRLAW